jgi:hypothetical protein
MRNITTVPPLRAAAKQLARCGSDGLELTLPKRLIWLVSDVSRCHPRQDVLTLSLVLPPVIPMRTVASS